MTPRRFLVSFVVTLAVFIIVLVIADAAKNAHKIDPYDRCVADGGTTIVFQGPHGNACGGGK